MWNRERTKMGRQENCKWGNKEQVDRGKMERKLAQQSDMHSYYGLSLAKNLIYYLWMFKIHVQQTHNVTLRI